MIIPQAKRPGVGIDALDRTPGRSPSVWRAWVVLGVFAAIAGALLGRAVQLRTEQGEFLQDQGAARYLRTVTVPAPRGVIRDRRGTALAMSAGAVSIWANPLEAIAARERWPELAAALGLDPQDVDRRLFERRERSFMYLRRQVAPEVGARVRDLEIPGVYSERGFRRYYVGAEITAQVVGFTDVDGQGREGVELAYDAVLRGEDGVKQVIQDRFGRSVEDVQNVRSARPGRDVGLTIDLRLQSLAYRALKAAVVRRGAAGGAAVVIGARTGEIHALVSQPSYNPNDSAQRTGGAMRNRAAADLFEPGSTVKPFSIAAALMAGAVRPDTPVPTSPGRLRVGRHLVRDRRDLGDLDVTGVLRQSSNVGIARIVLDVAPDELWRTFTGTGFGTLTGGRFVGEAVGVLQRSRRFAEHERATLAFGYGLSVTALQLARAYTIFANDGIRLDLSLMRNAGSGAARGGVRVLPTEVSRKVLAMLEEVVQGAEGTGRLARVPGYRVAGKTGTSRKAVPGGYAEDRYTSLFVGLAPASDPRFIAVVVVDEPRGAEYYGGLVAAPVFRSVMSDALRLAAAPPDSHRNPPRNAMAENYAHVFQDLRR